MNAAGKLAAQCSPNCVGSQCIIAVNGSFHTIRSALFKFGPCSFQIETTHIQNLYNTSNIGCWEYNSKLVKFLLGGKSCNIISIKPKSVFHVDLTRP